MMGAGGPLGCYDSVAEIYDRLAVPHLFARPAADLAVLLALPAPARLLEIGAGTGAAACAALRSAGPGSYAVALDPSLAMLRLARAKGPLLLVGGAAPGLPFADATFDGVLAGFVLSHLRDYQPGLEDMVRVLRRGAGLAVSAWGPAGSEPRKLWQEAAEAAVGPEPLAEAAREILPWEEWFSDPGRLEETLRRTGLEPVSIYRREYTTRTTVAEFLKMREVSLPARVLGRLLTREQLESFRRKVADDFQCRFGDCVEDTRDALLATGRKP